MSSDPSEPTPFRVSIPEDEIERLRRKITDTRLPEEPFVEGGGWDYGVDLDWLKEMRRRWLDDFNWSKVEAEMNTFNHFHVSIEGIKLHYIHQVSEREDAVPIILTHGWPGSFWEFHKVVEPLTNPPADQPAFHVVIPSLPGFGFSSPPPVKDWTMGDNARIFDHLMTGVLGYKSFMAQGGDWGGMVTGILGGEGFPACKLVGMNMSNSRPTLGALLTLPFFLLPTSWRQWLYSKIYSETELNDMHHSKEFMKNGMGYFHQQATRPLSIGYALYDSPVGILAWIGEKYIELMDPSIFPERIQEMLTTVSLYYLTGSIHTSALPYRENLVYFQQKLLITKPYGLFRFPYDVFMFPVAWTKATNPKMVFFRRHDKGGHFPALEVPDELVSDIRELFIQSGHVFNA